MAQLRLREYKDDVVKAIAMAAPVNFSPDLEKGVPISPIEEYVAAIDSYIDSFFERSISTIVLNDPDVLAKQVELDTVIAQKVADAKDNTKLEGDSAQAESAEILTP